MSASRAAFRAARQLRTLPIARTTTRRYATAGPEASPNYSQAIIGGLIGGGLAFAGGYTYYYFSGAKTLVNTAHQTKAYFEEAQNRLAKAAPEPNEALKWLRSTATTYAAFIPGASGYVNTAFEDLDAVRAKHGGKVDDIVRATYGEIKDVTKDKGVSLETATQVWEIIQKRLKEIGELAGDAAQDILNNHPDLKAKVGGNIDQLKEMGDKYGPEAKKQVDQTWDQVQDIIKGGVSMDTANKIRSVVQEKMELVKKMGDEAWKKGMEQAKPYLDKSPKVKELVEENADALKQGNFAELWEKVKDAASTGNTDAIEQYVKSATDKAKSQAGSVGGGSLDQYFKMIPGADKIMPKLAQLQEIGEKHGKEAEDLVKATYDDISAVVQKRVKQAEDLAKKAKDKAEKK
ncbi:hypothetical protein MMC34_004735 [Xylographa carneopallida]|nr:hypothetical protein [Xylographa carneopallida]